MSNQNNGETHIKLLTDVCQNVCTFIQTMTVGNMSKDEQINDLQLLCSDFKTQVEQINENVKKLANLLNFTINQNDSAINILTQWILSLSNKNVECVKKRKLYSSYSPLKLSLKDKTEMNESLENKSICSQYEKEKKNSSQKELKNVWKLQVKHDGKPSDLLKKTKQTTLKLTPQEEKCMIDITTFGSSTPKISILDSTSTFNPEVFNIKRNDVSNVDKNNLIYNPQMDDTSNISLSHFNTIIKPNKNALPIVKTKILKSNTSNKLNILHDQLCDETMCSPINDLKNEVISKNQNEIPNENILDSFDIIPGLNDKQNDLPNYKFKEDPVRKRNERKLLNGWDCKECCKFYEANNDNPIEAKSAMNHFSRHRSVKHQHHASTPPGFWDPI